MKNEQGTHPITGQPITGEHLVQASDELDRVFASGDYSMIVTHVAGLQRLARSAQRLARTVAIVAVVAILSGLFGSYYAYRVDHNAKAIDATNTFAVADAKNLKILCDRQNVDNAKRRALWQFVLDALTKAPGNDPAFTTGLTRLVLDAYAATDCNPARAVPPPEASSRVFP